MRLANEIFEELSDRFGIYSHERDEVEAIIEAKLKPVKDAIQYVVSFHSTGIGQLTHALAGLESALSMLTDEEVENGS